MLNLQQVSSSTIAAGVPYLFSDPGSTGADGDVGGRATPAAPVADAASAAGRDRLEVEEMRRVLVYGLGLSGIAVSRLLLDRGVGVVAIDDRDELELPEDLRGNPNFERLDTDQAERLQARTIDALILSPGVPKQRPLVARAKQMARPVLGEVEVAFRFLSSDRKDASDQICGITGSNGKSTTTQLVVELLGTDRAIACGNFGVPLSDCVRKARTQAFTQQNLVVELSSFQLEDTDRFRPKAAALLNISPDHLDRHGTAEQYLAAKQCIFAAQRAGDIAVLNADDETVRATSLNSGVRRREFSLDHPVIDGCYLRDGAVFLVEPGRSARRVFGRSDLKVVGDHNLANAMAALLLAIPLGLELSSVVERLAGFQGLPHRTQYLGEALGVRWYDDSKGTNIGATQQSLTGFGPKTVHLIAGGRSKGPDFEELRPAVASRVAHLYLVGEAASDLERDLGDLTSTSMAGTIEQAVKLASINAKPGEVVLLSPACASFDQFDSFVDRGKHFQRLVSRVLAASSAGEDAGG